MVGDECAPTGRKVEVVYLDTNAGVNWANIHRGVIFF